MLDQVVFKRSRNDVWCTEGTVSKKQCFKKIGDKLVTKKRAGVTATMQKNGDLVWSHGFVTKLYNACREPECDATLKDMTGEMKTWKTSDWN